MPTLTVHSQKSLSDLTPESAQQIIEGELRRQLDMQIDERIRDWNDRIDQTIASAAKAEQFGASLRQIFPFVRPDQIRTAATWRDLVRAILHAAGHDVSLF